MAEKLGDLDIDTLKAQYSIEMFNRKVERMQKVVSGADKQMSAWQRSWNTLSKVAGAFGVALGVGAVVSYIASLRNLGEEINRARGGFVAGTKAREDFDRSMGRFGDSDIGAINRLSTAFDNFFLGLKVKTVQAIEGFKLMMNPAAWKTVAGIPVGMKDQNELAATLGIQNGKKIDSARDLLALEDQLARLQEIQTSGMDDQLAIIEKQLEIERQRVAIAMRTDDPNARRIVNDASNTIGGLKMRSRELQRQREVQNAGARAELEAIEQIRAGQSQNAEMTRIRAKYEAQISQALKEQNTELAGILQRQRDIELTNARVAAHQMTPRERLRERQSARKARTAIRQTDAAEAEMRDRIRKGIRGTPGSELENFRARQGQQSKGPAQFAQEIAKHVADIAAAFAEGGK